jgi:hypothetical protein
MRDGERELTACKSCQLVGVHLRLLVWEDVGLAGRAHLGLRCEALPGEGEGLHLARGEDGLLVGHGVL